jgi:hypothetical protein
MQVAISRHYMFPHIVTALTFTVGRTGKAKTLYTRRRKEEKKVESVQEK